MRKKIIVEIFVKGEMFSHCSHQECPFFTATYNLSPFEGQDVTCRLFDKEMGKFKDGGMKRVPECLGAEEAE